MCNLTVLISCSSSIEIIARIFLKQQTTNYMTIYYSHLTYITLKHHHQQLVLTYLVFQFNNNEDRSVFNIKGVPVNHVTYK